MKSERLGQYNWAGIWIFCPLVCLAHLPSIIACVSIIVFVNSLKATAIYLVLVFSVQILNSKYIQEV